MQAKAAPTTETTLKLFNLTDMHLRVRDNYFETTYVN
jgi:hypothetical protein